MAPTSRLYLVTPPHFEPARLADTLAGLLGTGGIACLRLELADPTEAAIVAAAGALLPLCRAFDVPLVLAGSVNLVRPLGLDGVHLEGGALPVRAARHALGEGAIIGAAAGASRHAAMTAAEEGADYVSLGPFGAGEKSEEARALLAWWSEMIEIPSVAEGGLDPAAAADLAAHADFLALRDEIWSDAAGPAAALAGFLQPG